MTDEITTTDNVFEALDLPFEAKALEIVKKQYGLFGFHLVLAPKQEAAAVKVVATALGEAEERATLAEREACKAIADRQVEVYGTKYGQALDAGMEERTERFYNYRDAAEFIANAIDDRNVDAAAIRSTTDHHKLAAELGEVMAIVAELPLDRDQMTTAGATKLSRMKRWKEASDE